MEVTLQATLKGHQNQIFTLEKGDDYTLFSGGNDKGVVEWDLREMKFRRILCAVAHPVYALHRIEGTSLLAIGLRSGDILIVDYVQQKLETKLSIGKGAIFALRTVRHKSELIAVGEEGVAYVFDLVSFKLLYRFRISTTTVRTIVVSTDERQVYFGDKEGCVFQYESSDYHLISQSLIHKMPVTALLFHENELLSGGRDAKMYRLRKEDLGIVQEITPHMFTIYGIVKHSENPIIATVSRDKTWKIWDISSFTLLKNVSIDKGYDSHHLSINTVLWDRNHLYTAGDDKMIKVWAVQMD